MKKLILLIGLLSLIAGITQAQTNIAFLSVSADDGVKVRGGIGIPVWGPVVSYTYLTLGRYGEIDIDLGVVKKLTSKVTGVLLLGPNVDMVKDDTRSASTYLPFVAGVLGGYDLSEDSGVFGFIKYRFSVDGATTYVDGWEVGGGMFAGF